MILRADEHHWNAGGLRGGDAGLHGGAKHRFIDAYDRVVRADLPDYHPSPGRTSARFFRRSSVLAASSPPTPAFLTSKSTPALLFEFGLRVGRDSYWPAELAPIPSVEDEPMAKMSFGRPTLTLGNASGSAVWFESGAFARA